MEVTDTDNNLPVAECPSEIETKMNTVHVKQEPTTTMDEIMKEVNEVEKNDAIVKQDYITLQDIKIEFDENNVTVKEEHTTLNDIKKEVEEKEAVATVTKEDTTLDEGIKGGSEVEENTVKTEFTTLDEIMKDVLKNHKQETHYSCSKCAFTMTNKRHYVMHMLTIHTTFNEETRLMHFCHVCDYKTMYKDRMKRHIETDHMAREKLNCPFCSFTSLYAINLRRHISIHQDMQNLVCSHPQCDFKTSYKYSLQRHEIKMHGNQCSVCHYKNKNRSAVQRHLRTVHDIYEIHQCDKCKFKTFYLMTLKRHNAREHKGMMKTNFTSVKKTKKELTPEEEEEIKSLFKD